MGIKKDAFEFLGEFKVDALKGRGVLQTATNLLNGLSVKPLIALMKEHGIDSLVDEENDWYLTVNNTFSNPRSTESKQGNIANLSRPGIAFLRQNRSINPHF